MHMSNPKRQEINDHIARDPWANHLGAKLEEVQDGYSRFSLHVKREFMNFHGMTHGGLVFSLGDIAFAAASNSRGQMAVALDVTISFLQAGAVGDTLIAECTELSQNGPIALYDIIVKNEGSGELVSKSQATVYRKKQRFVE